MEGVGFFPPSICRNVNSPDPMVSSMMLVDDGHETNLDLVIHLFISTAVLTKSLRKEEQTSSVE